MAAPIALWLITPVLLSLISVADCLEQPPISNVKRSLETIGDKYDYIIVGGGTSGLVVANRLSVNSNDTVLVVEYGDFADTINVTVPFFTTQDQSSRMYTMTSTPQANLAGRVANLRIGNVVGGSSTVNGMAWDRGSAIDYDSWEALGNPGWGWQDLVPYFRKSSTFAPPAPQYIKKYGFKWSPEAYGDGPIHVGYPAWQWPAAVSQANAWIQDLNAPKLADGADGANVGIAWLPQNSDGIESIRSSAETAYYEPVSGRANLQLLVRHYGANIVFEDNVAVGINIKSRDGDLSKYVNSEHIILAAGTVNTPRILQLSGIGPAKLLEGLGIEVVEDAPGVGANFQDHPAFFVVYQFNNNTSINPDSMQDQAFYDAAWEEYRANKTGPFSHAWGNRVVFQSLQDLDPRYESIAESLEAQEPLEYLPRVYAESPALLRGFLQQRKVIQSQFLSADAGVVEITFGGAASVPVALQKPLSRGTIWINSTDADPSIPPLIDFNTNSNPVDMVLLTRALQRTREFMGSLSVASLDPVELSPGPLVESDVDIEMAMRESLLSPSFDHPVGTAAMMPKELGGVVDTHLQVHGVRGVWVVDASTMPLLPAAHTQSTVYAVAEHAADLIIEHSRRH